MAGICIFNIVPVRAVDSDKSEMVTQLLFGDNYEIIKESENQKWLHIKISDDEYEGWIDKKLHFEIDPLLPDLFNNNSSNHYCSESVGYIESGEISKIIFFGSYLPTFDGEYVYIGNKQFAYKGKYKKIEKSLTAETIIQNANMFLETPYLWGGKSHAGIDCSGLVQMVFRSCGHQLMRDAWQQASMGSRVESLEKAKSGDLAFFSNDVGRVTHVGILLDTKNIIHAHGKVRIDKIDDKGIINSDSGLYSHKLDGIRSIIGQALN